MLFLKRVGPNQYQNVLVKGEPRGMEFFYGMDSDIYIVNEESNPFGAFIKGRKDIENILDIRGNKIRCFHCQAENELVDEVCSNCGREMEYSIITKAMYSEREKVENRAAETLGEIMAEIRVSQISNYNKAEVELDSSPEPKQMTFEDFLWRSIKDASRK